VFVMVAIVVVVAFGIRRLVPDTERRCDAAAQTCAETP
jgi:hypothetical protein